MASAGSPATRGYGITKSDMEASRLVFVFVKDSKPRRKVAVPVPDNYTWDDFLNQVKHKLRLSAVGNIYLASSGQQILNLDELQDIDELCVEEAAAPAQSAVSAPAVPTEAALRSAGVAPTSSGDLSHANGPSTPQYRSQASDKHKVVMADSGASSQGKDETGEQKYVKRSGNLRRVLQRIFPVWLQPSLPVSTKDVADDKAGAAEGRTSARRRRRRGGCSSRNVLLLLAACSCLATMIVLYLRVSAQSKSGVTVGGY